MALLEKIKSPSDVKALSQEEAVSLAAEIREKLIQTTLNNGGHLASNLGVVELTIALHRVFSSPDDKIIWDVGHQSYVHKMLTGRLPQIDTLRQFGGISGFTRRTESIHDPFGAGHSGTSISAAEGIAAANKLKGCNDYTIAVVGDGAFTGGMIYEALNDAPQRDLRLIVILNDNEMSISQNVGGMSKYLSDIVNSKGYFSFKRWLKNSTLAIPLVGQPLYRFSRKTKNFFKRVLTNGNIFESLGWDYFGLIDGNDITALETVLSEAKQSKTCCLVHIRTKKGKGYEPAEANPDVFHAVSPVSSQKKNQSFSKAFGERICKEAETNADICAVTAAMSDGTGLTKFSEKYKDRFFDVGITEEHALTFCAALAAGGKRPVFAVYSTFAQRCYDQIIHDASLQRLPVILALDRAGLVGDDGPTHHGVFDVSFLNAIPYTEIYSPDSYAELDSSFTKAFRSDKICAVRYPRGGETQYNRNGFVTDGNICCKDFGDNINTVVITYGSITANVVKAAEMLESVGQGVRIIKLVRIKPIDFPVIFELTDGFKNIYFVEEGIKRGGISQTVVTEFALAGRTDGVKIKINAIDEEFITHGNVNKLYEKYGLSAQAIAIDIEKMIYDE